MARIVARITPIRYITFVLGIAASFVLLLPAATLAQGSPPAASATRASPSVDDIIVRYRSGVSASERDGIRSSAGVRREGGLLLARAELVAPEAGVAVARAIRELESDADVLYAEPNALREAFTTPDDEFFELQWGLRNTGQLVKNTGGTAGADIDAVSAWNVTTGSRDVVAAVIDSGTDTGHPDLAPNLWRNPGESGGGQSANGIDDDGNGFVDDVNGWDFADGDAEPLDADGHGTHVAGIVGASGDDGVGVTGVAWAPSLMTLRVLGADGSGTVADVLSAYAYAARSGARVVNLSFGGGVGSRAERDALAAASEVLFVAAAGNSSVNNDVSGTYPCSYDLANVICVAASDRNDVLAQFSNRGMRTVDLAAPGVNIASTLPLGEHGYLSGTSMAAPYVTGAAVLALSRTPSLSVSQLREVLLTSVDPVAALRSSTVTGGRLNAARAVEAAGRADADASPPAGPGTGPAPVTQSPPALAGPPANAFPPALDVAVPTPPAVAPGRPAPPAPAVVDRSAPALFLSSARHRRASDLRSRGLRVTVRCSEACRVSVVMTLDAATGRRLGLRDRRVASARVTLARAGTRVVVLRPAATARRRLRGNGRATLRATASDQAGNRRRATRTVLLRR